MNRKTRRGCPAVRVVMFPKDTNAAGNIFGGVILSHIDVAGAVAARRVCTHRVVTVSFKEVEFKKPVYVGDILTCWAEVTRIGRSSIGTYVWVEVERNGKNIPVTEGAVVYVAVDREENPLPVKDALTATGRAFLRAQEAKEAKEGKEGKDPAKPAAKPRAGTRARKGRSCSSGCS